MRVVDLMVRNVVTIRDDAMLADAVTILAEAHVSGLAVVDGHQRLVGVLSASDILAAEAEAGDNRNRAEVLSGTLVRDAMSRPPLSISPDLELREASLQMEYAEVHRLFVIEAGRLVGVISRSDVSRAHALGKLG